MRIVSVNYFASALADTAQSIVLFLVVPISLVVVAWTLGRAEADPMGDVGTPWELRIADSQPEIMHFNLLGPDWARIPEGYSGVTPEKVTAKLNIPKEYVVLHNPFRTSGPLTQNESNIPLAVFYPSMRGAGEGGEAEGSSPKSHVYVALDTAREEASRKGVGLLLSHEGMKRNSQLDVDGLCGYVDNEHPGNSGQEFYSTCDELEQTFLIDCFQPINNRRRCGETAFLEGQIGAVLSYQYQLLKDHHALLEATKNLVRSFIQPDAEKHN